MLYEGIYTLFKVKETIELIVLYFYQKRKRKFLLPIATTFKTDDEVSVSVCICALSCYIRCVCAFI